MVMYKYITKMNYLDLRRRHTTVAVVDHFIRSLFYVGGENFKGNKRYTF